MPHHFSLNREAFECEPFSSPKRRSDSFSFMSIKGKSLRRVPFFLLLAEKPASHTPGNVTKMGKRITIDRKRSRTGL